MTKKSVIKQGSIVLISALASALFILLFGVQGMQGSDFWAQMSCTIIVLLLAGVLADPGWLPSIMRDVRERTAHKILIGIFSAAILYGIFLAGYYLSRRFLPFAESNIESVYGLKSSASIARIVALMILIIGPGEELFWRGFLQRTIADHTGGLRALLITTLLYAGVHAARGNIMLVIAAFVAGGFWGLLYIRYRSILLNIVSHTVWDLLVFVLVPFNF